ncbi:hypothetical protein NWF24_30895 [Variovorax paradoxus]|uniref:hypothetical protein n=1 Tax=Variovorax paradoxus TaxID=34073 RepID=UPI0021AD3378|nr:hypothetical protein [Variovorax paradoxus]UVH57197.1 hypothetical protein NWF24_30895 [Variovorax paradoxus]
MKAAKPKQRGAPPIAAKNAADALTNILQKRDLLIQTLRNHGKAEGSTDALKALPKSIRQFNLWDGSSNHATLDRSEVPRCHPNSNQTLRAHPDVRFEVQQLIDSVRKHSERQSPDRREESIRGLQGRLKAERDLTAIANREIIRARFLLSELRDSYDVVKYAKQSSDAEAKRMIAELQSRVLALEEENADLKKRLSRDARLRRV